MRTAFSVGIIAAVAVVVYSTVARTTPIVASAQTGAVEANVFAIILVVVLRVSAIVFATVVFSAFIKLTYKQQLVTIIVVSFSILLVRPQHSTCSF